LAALTFCFCCLRFSDPDLWWHLKLGQEVWRTHAVPSADHWSFTVPGHPWIAHEWLAQLSLYLTYSTAGYRGLQLWLCLLSAATVALVYLLSYRYSGSPVAAMAGAFLAFFFGTIGFSLRPQVLGYLFLVVELLILERSLPPRHDLARPANPNLLWSLPPLFAIWVNCHGSYALGIGILSVALLCAYFNRPTPIPPFSPQATPLNLSKAAAILAACILALLLNPVGAKLLTYPLNVFTHQQTSLGFVSEWLPATIKDPRDAALFLFLGAAAIAGLRGHARLKIFEILTLIPVVFLALEHTRMAYVFGLVAGPVLARMLADRPTTPRAPIRVRPDRLPSNALLLVAAVACCVLAFPRISKIEANIDQQNPVKAVQFLRSTHPQGPLLNDYKWGGYLIWSLGEYPVFVDGRGDVYDWDGVLAKYRDWSLAHSDPASLLNEYNIQLCLLPLDAPMSQVLPHLAGWKQIYRDEISQIFARN
jgi:hypothetical protein